MKGIMSKIWRVAAGLVIGCVVSYLLVAALDAMLEYPNVFNRATGNVLAICLVYGVCTAGCIILLLLFVREKPISSQGFDGLPRHVAGLIDAIIESMRYRRSVRADVRQELTDHFNDALAGCETEEQKTVRVKELLADFGDVELLGILMRRAKKRCRPLWRTMIVRMFQAAGVLVILFFVYVGWFFCGKPAVTTNYLDVLNRQVRPVADEGLNAYPLYIEAARLYQKPTDDNPFDLTPRSLTLLSESQRQVLSGWLAANRKSLELIGQGNEKPYYWPVYSIEQNEDGTNPSLITVLLPHISQYRDMARLVCWQALVDADAGRMQEAFNHVMDAYQFGQKVHGQETPLIEQLVSAAITMLSTDTLRIMLDDHIEDVDAATLDSARKRLGGYVDASQFEIDFGAERLFMYDETQRCFTASRFGRSHLYLPRLKEITDSDLTIDDQLAFVALKGFQVLFTHPDKDETLKQMEILYAEFEKGVRQTPAAMKAQNPEIQKKLEAFSEKNIFIRYLMPALAKVAERSHRSRVDSMATLTIIAILQYHKEHGQYPESLSALAEGGLLRQLPMDPYSDKPLVYRRTEEGFVLYSAGMNLTDDGGVEGTKNGKFTQWTDHGDVIFWPVRKEEAMN
ncbi:MAG: hypothetical protein ABFD91_10110 [Anaerohalosphaeraceae bacterium]